MFSHFVDNEFAGAYTVFMRVLISGASVAGPGLAFFLKNSNCEVTIVERAKALRDGGYAVDIRGAALEVIRRMGLREALRPLEVDTQSNSIIDAQGRRFARMPRGFGVIDDGDIEIMRGDLVRVLYDATRPYTRYRFGDSIAAIDERTAAIEVTFESGAREEYDIVVGADGVHSRTRQLAFREGATPFLHEMGSAMAIWSAPNHLGLQREQLLWSGVRRIASIKSANSDRELKICVFFQLNPGTFDHRDVDAQRQLVAAAFAGEGWEFPRLVAAMHGAEDFYSDVTCQVKLDRFSAGRVALIGDAAYCPSPLSGQGTSLALVGAYVLGRALIELPGDPRAAFARFDAALRPFVVRNQAIALKLSEAFAPRSPFQLWARNLAMRMLPYMPGSSMMMKLAMRDISRAARDIALPLAA